MYLMYLIPWTVITAPGVVMTIVLVIRNISVVMSPPTIPALGLK
jgi:hypothetical protein